MEAPGPDRYAQRSFDSADAGWTSLRLLRQTLPSSVPDVRLDPITDQLVDLQTGGERVVLSRDGRGRVSARLGPGSLSTTPPGKPSHLSWRPGGGGHIAQLRLLLPGTVLERVGAELGGRRRPAADALRFDDAVLRQVVHGAWTAAREGAPDLYAAAVAELVAVHLLTVHGGSPTPDPPPPDEPRVRRAVEVLHASLAQPVSLATLAEQVGLSRYHLLRLFRRHTGRTPHEYLLALRLEQARRLLRETGLPVGQVAVRCGFVDASHFSKTFRRAVGVAPSAYRAAAVG
ncbi:helix-turn-helix domain-containing protein [Desertihabitans brevis]|uniref:Helix-turn-helix domain-containing protein n=1 Tax=Desertihabitans brevis TaxID=2268447 RepID=A0A367YSD4_9ACTN|nr:helix-turn-helix domain-containing protein [Desertihabitans brevis]RCK68710.1 helix-turn-helix domain-containing protein [Desertihabitans brevis]